MLQLNEQDFELVKERFKDHTATITHEGASTIIDWSKQDSSHYAIQYILRGNHIFITGDLEEAVFVLSETARLESFKKIELKYYHRKLKAVSLPEIRASFDGKVAARTIKEYVDEESLEGNAKELCRHCTLAAAECTDKQEWKDWLRGADDNYGLEILDENWWEWMSDCGDTYSLEFLSYLLGLQMIYQQCEEKLAKVVSETATVNEFDHGATENYKAYRKALWELSIGTILAAREATHTLDMAEADVFEKIATAMKTDLSCPKCAGPLYKSDLPQYDHVCPHCDENF